MTATNSVGCFSQDSVRVNVDPLPVARFSYTLKARDVTFTNESEHADSYEWDYGDGDKSSDENTFHRYKLDGTYTVVLTTTNACGSDDTTVNIKIENLGFEKMLNENYVIYPNPATTALQVRRSGLASSRAEIELIDLNGRVVLASTMNKGIRQRQVDISTLVSGIYQVRVTDPNGTKTTAIVIGTR